MTYWINVWRDSRPSRIEAEPAVQHWSSEEQAVEEIVAGFTDWYYDETIRVEGQIATVIDLSYRAEVYHREAQEEHRADLAMSPSWAPL